MSQTRRFPPPCSVEELNDAFVVDYHNGQQLAYVYFEDEPGRRSAAKLLRQRRGAADCGVGHLCYGGALLRLYDFKVGVIRMALHVLVIRLIGVTAVTKDLQINGAVIEFGAIYMMRVQKSFLRR